jgi:hypothetical protein
MGRPQADTDARTGASDGRRALAEAAPERAAEVLRLAENAVVEARIYPESGSEEMGMDVLGDFTQIPVIPS